MRLESDFLVATVTSDLASPGTFSTTVSGPMFGKGPVTLKTVPVTTPKSEFSDFTLSSRGSVIAGTAWDPGFVNPEIWIFDAKHGVRLLKDIPELVGVLPPLSSSELSGLSEDGRVLVGVGDSSFVFRLVIPSSAFD
jgi:hypothetical protein